MTTVADARAENPIIALFAATFALIATAAWLAALSGIAIALACYGALLVSQHLLNLYRQPDARRSSALLGLALTWLSVLAFCAASLPSNFGAALI